MLKSLAKTFESIIVVDTETTGLDCKSDEIIELAAMRIACTGEECQVKREIDTLICLSPGEILPVEITKLTGIDEQMLLKDGVSRAEAVKLFSELFDNSRTLLVAYNAQFDLCFLYHFLRKFGSFDVLRKVKMLDALTVYKDRRNYPHKLSDAISEYALKAQNTHRAIDDVRATLELLLAMECENSDLDRYINLFGYNPKYGVYGQRISSVTYLPQSYNDSRKLYESPIDFL